MKVPKLKREDVETKLKSEYIDKLKPAILNEEEFALYDVSEESEKLNNERNAKYVLTRLSGIKENENYLLFFNSDLSVLGYIYHEDITPALLKQTKENIEELANEISSEITQ